MQPRGQYSVFSIRNLVAENSHERDSCAPMRFTCYGFLKFENFLELREISRSAVGDEGDILEANAADFRVIKPRLDGNDLAWLQDALGVLPRAGRFMDFQT